MTPRLLSAAGLLMALSASAGVSQTPATTIDPASLRRSSFTWNQAEIEYGFSHWDLVFPSRPVPRGARVHDLPQGKPIAALAVGTAGAQQLERYIAEQKVAGLIIQNGGVRLERYALGHRRSGREIHPDASWQRLRQRDDPAAHDVDVGRDVERELH